mmetsp:Transcript_39261/g.58325  ORF Transcript_39261/g.58325 Transcript_39261/m.58325 type:complete len:88 (+) Transcript_39261:1159-1422(+)
MQRASLLMRGQTLLAPAMATKAIKVALVDEKPEPITEMSVVEKEDIMEDTIKVYLSILYCFDMDLRTSCTRRDQLGLGSSCRPHHGA